MRVQSFASSAHVKPGGKASFVIWVWTTKAAASGVSVRASVATASHVGSAQFSVCPTAKGSTCTVGKLPLGQAAEVQATVKVGTAATAGEHVQVSAQASASGAKSSNGSATDVVTAAPGTSSSPASGTGSGGGSGFTLPAPGTLPPITGAGVSPSDPTSLFPTVGASPGSSSLGSPHATPHPSLHAVNAASTVPVDERLIGGQLAGLAVLAAAVTIAIARLTLRKPRQQSGEDDAPRPPES